MLLVILMFRYKLQTFPKVWVWLSKHTHTHWGNPGLQILLCLNSSVGTAPSKLDATVLPEYLEGMY